MKKDPIVEEIRKFRAQHARKFKYDIKKIIEDYEKSEEKRKSGAKNVSESSAPYILKKDRPGRAVKS